MEYNFFKSQSSNRAFDLWADNFPESFNGYDTERWVKLVYTLLVNGEELERVHLEKTKNAICGDLTDDAITIYIDQYKSMSALFQLISNKFNVEE